MTSDTIAAAEADRVVGPAAQPSLLDRVAELEAAVAVLQGGGIQLAGMFEKLANAVFTIEGRLKAAEENICGLAELDQKQADVIHDIAVAAAAKKPGRRRLPGRP